MTTVSKAIADVQVRSEPQGAFSQDRRTSGGILLLTLRGTLDHAFEGRKTAETVQSPKVIVNLREVRRFASWGMQEWMDFLRITAERDLYLVECSTYAASQLNLITGLLGHAKLVSFYASYRCAGCGEEFETLFSIPNDRGAIRQLPETTYACATCQGQVRLEEYPAAFFDAISNRPAYEIDDEVLKYLRRELGYELPDDLTRFRAFRRTRGPHTYLRLAGSTTTMAPDRLVNSTSGTTVLDLSRVRYDALQTKPWRTYIEAARAKVKSLQLMSSPVGFLEALVTPADLHDKVSVRSFALAYNCARCETDTTEVIDVAANLEQLVEGTAPASRCPSCQSLLVATLSPELVEVLRSLPARPLDPVLEKLLARAIAEPDDKLEDGLRAGKALPTAPSTSRAIYLMSGLSVLVLAGLGVVGYELWRERSIAPQRAPEQDPVVAPQPPPPSFVRPNWITSDMPSSAYCRDLIDRLMCVGVSSYQPTRDAAVAEANDAALDELVNTIGIAVKDPFFRATVAPLYGPARAKRLAALEDSDTDRTHPAVATIAAVDAARRRVVQLLQASGGPAVPAQRTDWYWEEYAKTGGGTETLVFVRYDVSLEAERALIQRYSTPVTALGSSGVTAFPALAWADPDFAGGVMLTKVGHPLTEAGLSVGDLVVAVEGHAVADGDALANELSPDKHRTGPLHLSVKTGEGQPKVIEVR